MKGSPMRRTPGYEYCVEFLTIIVACIMVLFGVAAEQVCAAEPTPFTLEVIYDRATLLVSIHARRTPLNTVLQELSGKAPLRIDTPHKELLNEQITVEMNHLPLEEVLTSLLEGFNSIFLYSSNIDPPGNATTLRLVRVLVGPRKATVPLEARADSSLEHREDKEHTAEPSMETLGGQDISTRPDAYAALKDFAPEPAVGMLEDWLQGNDQQLRLFAAAQLARVADDRAISALSAVLGEDNSLLRQVAANSLARIREDGATRTLIAAYLEGDPGLKHAAATAISAYGDERSQQALASTLGGGQASGGQTARELIVQSLRRPAAQD